MDDESVKRYALRLADDALVLGHRLSEWSSRGPYLEEDLALTNVALDYLGRARLFYGYAVKLSDDGSTEDSFAYLRGCREFTNHLIHELPVGDFAFTMTRQYLVDEFNQRLHGDGRDGRTQQTATLTVSSSGGDARQRLHAPR